MLNFKMIKLWRGGRVVDRIRLEIGRLAIVRRFKSSPLRFSPTGKGHNILCPYSILYLSKLSCYIFRLHSVFIGSPITRGLSPLPVCVLNDEQLRLFHDDLNSKKL